MEGVDVIVFTGGIGENHANTRLEVTKGLEFMGIEIDPEINASSFAVETLLSTTNSKVKVVIIPTDEEYMIASDTMEILNSMKI